MYKRQLRTSQKSADRTTAYYEAENKANDILLKISQTIEKNLDSENETVFYENVKTELDGKDGISFSDADKLDYPVEMAEQQFLSVSLLLSFEPVSYTHLDVYKRQEPRRIKLSSPAN